MHSAHYFEILYSKPNYLPNVLQHILQLQDLHVLDIILRKCCEIPSKIPNSQDWFGNSCTQCASSIVGRWPIVEAYVTTNEDPAFIFIFNPWALLTINCESICIIGSVEDDNILFSIILLFFHHFSTRKIFLYRALCEISPKFQNTLLLYHCIEIFSDRTLKRKQPLMHNLWRLCPTHSLTIPITPRALPKTKTAWNRINFKRIRSMTWRRSYTSRYIQWNTPRRHIYSQFIYPHFYYQDNLPLI